MLHVDFVFLQAASGETGLYVRDVILGLNDGLVSMFLLLLGISGGGAEATEVSTSDERYCHRLRNPGVAVLLAWLFPRVVGAGATRRYHWCFGRCHQYGTFRIYWFVTLDLAFCWRRVDLLRCAATKSQKEVTDGDLKLEKEHFKHHRDVELAQVCAAIAHSSKSKTQAAEFLPRFVKFSRN